MGTTIRVTSTEGTLLMRAAHGTGFPEKVGDRAFSHNVRATLLKQRRQLYKALKKLSPIMAEESLLYFGPRENWQAVERAEKEIEQLPEEMRDERRKYRVKDRVAQFEVELTGAMRDGLYWILYLWAHPGSPSCLAAGLQEDVVWPLAEQLGRVRFLEEEIGLTKNETILVKDDEEYEAEDAEREAKKLEGSKEPLKLEKVK